MSESKVTNKSQAPPAEPQMIPASWYLGGKHDIKILTSVDGDFDPTVLGELTAVPKHVGEIALSVECMVSHDYIVGDFENDLLAKIATNFPVVTSAKTTPIANEKPQTAIAAPITEAPPQTKPQRSPSMERFSVPNPFTDDSTYKPVPNPLAVTISPPESPVTISPPDSPVSVTVPIPATISSALSRKRKSVSIPLDLDAPRSNKAARREVRVPLVTA